MLHTRFLGHRPCGSAEDFSRRWLFNKCPFISFIRIILIDRAYYLKGNLIGIFPVGVVFLFISFVKYI